MEAQACTLTQEKEAAEARVRQLEEQIVQVHGLEPRMERLYAEKEEASKIMKEAQQRAFKAEKTFTELKTNWQYLIDEKETEIEQLRKALQDARNALDREKSLNETSKKRVDNCKRALHDLSAIPQLPISSTLINAITGLTLTLISSPSGVSCLTEHMLQTS